MLTGLPPMLFYDLVSKQFIDWDVYCQVSAPFKALIEQMTVHDASLRPFANVSALKTVWQEVKNTLPHFPHPIIQQTSRLMQQLERSQTRYDIVQLMGQLNPAIESTL